MNLYLILNKSCIIIIFLVFIYFIIHFKNANSNQTELFENNSNNSIAFKSLGHLRYLSALKHVDLVLGNSSSGITEAPCFNTPTVNVGERQNGRLKADSVVDCDLVSSNIIRAIENALKRNTNSVTNPYGKSGASDEIVDIIKKIDYNKINNKTFSD